MRQNVPGERADGQRQNPASGSTSRFKFATRNPLALAMGVYQNVTPYTGWGFQLWGTCRSSGLPSRPSLLFVRGGGEDSKMTGETLKNGALQCPSTGRGLKHGLHRESLLSYIAPHTRSGDFNLIFSAQKSGREVAPHTGAGVSTRKLRPWYYPGAVAPHTGSGDFNSYAKAESMFDNVTPRVGSGDFNRHSNCRRFQFSVAPHTESGNFNLICPGKTLESGRHFPHGKWGFQRHTRH